MPEPIYNPSLTIGMALLAGALCLVLARHLRLPSIVLLLLAGVVLGPDGVGIIQPEGLEGGLSDLVEFGVAVILFEGGLNLDLRRLRREALVIRRLVSIGALVTAAGAAVCARALMGWNWTIAILFGTLVIVTGPTVMAPLLRRIKVKRNVSTILEAEGVLIDPVGAVIALVTLGVVVGPASPSVGGGALGIGSRLGFGMVLGVGTGFMMGFLLRRRRAIPDGLQNITVLAFVFGLFQLSEAFLTESGIMAVTMAGLVIGNMRTQVLRELQEFKEQLTLLLIGLLFVLLAADVRLAGVRALGWPGLWTVLCLMLLVRPLNILVSTAGLPVPWNERAFMAWLAPRGIVAAAVASHFNHVLDQHDMAGGDELLALVFLVIAITVVVQGVSGGVVARLLGVRLPEPKGVCILGANKLARALARVLAGAGVEVTLIDSSDDFAQEAQDEGLRVVYGNGLEERTLLRARIDTMATAIGLTPNEHANLLFVRDVMEDFKLRDTFVALRAGHDSVTAKQVESLGASVLFGKPHELERWYVRLERELAAVECWTWLGADAIERRSDAAENPGSETSGGEAAGRAGPGGGTLAGVDAGGAIASGGPGGGGGAKEDAKEASDEDGRAHQEFPAEVLPLAWEREGKVRPYDGTIELRADDRVHLAVFLENEGGKRWLRGHGWTPAEPPAEPAPHAEPAPAAVVPAAVGPSGPSPGVRDHA